MFALMLLCCVRPLSVCNVCIVANGDKEPSSTLPVSVSEKSFDRNSDAECLVWHTNCCRWATGDTAGTAGPLSSFQCFWIACGLLLFCLIQSLTGCGHFWLTERSRLLTVVNYLLCSRCYLGFMDLYWARCCIFSIHSWVGPRCRLPWP